MPLLIWPAARCMPLDARPLIWPGARPLDASPRLMPFGARFMFIPPDARPDARCFDARPMGELLFGARDARPICGGEPLLRLFLMVESQRTANRHICSIFRVAFLKGAQIENKANLTFWVRWYTRVNIQGGCSTCGARPIPIPEVIWLHARTLPEGFCVGCRVLGVQCTV